MSFDREEVLVIIEQWNELTKVFLVINIAPDTPKLLCLFLFVFCTGWQNLFTLRKNKIVTIQAYLFSFSSAVLQGLCDKVYLILFILINFLYVYSF